MSKAQLGFLFSLTSELISPALSETLIRSKVLKGKGKILLFSPPRAARIKPEFEHESACRVETTAIIVAGRPGKKADQMTIISSLQMVKQTYSMERESAEEAETAQTKEAG